MEGNYIIVFDDDTCYVGKGTMPFKAFIRLAFDHVATNFEKILENHFFSILKDIEETDVDTIVEAFERFVQLKKIVTICTIDKILY